MLQNTAGLREGEEQWTDHNRTTSSERLHRDEHCAKDFPPDPVTLRQPRFRGTKAECGQ